MKKINVLVSFLLIFVFVVLGLKYFDTKKAQIKVDANDSKVAEKQPSPTFVLTADPIYTSANSQFKKVQNNVYYREKALNADLATFKVVAGMYSKDKNSVFALSCASEGFYDCVVVLEGADPATFTALTNVLAKDTSHVFYYGKILEDADPATIAPAGQVNIGSKSEITFIKDKSHVWYVYGLGYSQILPNADSATFEAPTWYYSKDVKNVYFFENIVLGADPATFEPLKEIYYGKDIKNVYFKEKVIKNADPKTFMALGGDYFQDSTSVYKEGLKMLDTEPSTFRVLNSDEGASITVNKNNVYHGGLKILGADAVTFTAIGENYGKDKNFVYFKTRKVSGADLATFRASTYVAKDKNNYYEFDKILTSPSESQYGGWEALK